MSRTPHRSIRIFKVHIEVASCVQFRWSQQRLTISRLHPRSSSGPYNGAQNVHSKSKVGQGSLQLPQSRPRVKRQSRPLHDLPKHNKTNIYFKIQGKYNCSSVTSVCLHHWTPHCMHCTSTIWDLCSKNRAAFADERKHMGGKIGRKWLKRH